MSKKGLDVLVSLLETFPANRIECVIGSRDPNVEKDYYLEIKDCCAKHKIVFFDKKEKHKVQSEYVISISWRWLIPTDTFKLIVVHDSLLPKYRGFAPLVCALINGENQIGVTALFAAKQYDEGEIIAQSSAKISYPIKISEAINQIATCYAKVVKEICKLIFEGKALSSKSQDESLASYCLWRDEEDYRIDWNQNSTAIKRFIDSVGFPYKGASALLNGTLIRIIDAEVLSDVIIENRVAGKIIFTKEEFPVVVCKQGLLKIIHAMNYENETSVLPLKKFRSRLT